MSSGSGSKKAGDAGACPSLLLEFELNAGRSVILPVAKQNLKNGMKQSLSLQMPLEIFTEVSLTRSQTGLCMIFR